jgi:L-ribulokinase
MYKKIYSLYHQMYDAFGTSGWSGKMFNVMKDLLALRDEARRNKK